MAGKAAGPKFGSAFIPKMLLQPYAKGRWGPAKIVPFAPFTLSPATVVFHYAQEIFEGFKAYRQPDGSICLFRPDRNFARLNASAERLCMPQIDTQAACANVGRLIKTFRAKMPAPPQTLYVRPFMFATDTVIGVHPSDSYIFCVIICVVAGYFSSDDPRGVRLRTETEYVRAAPGGTGATKCGGNYAASLAAQGQAARDGFDQVVWLDAKEHAFIEEMGGMNIMFVLDGKLVTPALSGSILPGVTRDTLLQLARSLGRKTEERAVSAKELLAANKAGRLEEVFACGTAAAITPIREIMHRGQVLYRNPGDKPGPLTTQLRQRLLDIQFGAAPDPFGWRYKLKMR